MTTIAFPLRALVERDAKGDLFREVQAHVTRVADFLDGDGRKIARTLQGKDSIAYSVITAQLTTRLLAIAGVIYAGRDWLDRRDVDPEHLRSAANKTLPSHNGKWVGVQNIPEELVELCTICDALALKTKGAQQRLLRAMEQEKAA